MAEQTNGQPIINSEVPTGEENKTKINAKNNTEGDPTKTKEKPASSKNSKSGGTSGSGTEGNSGGTSGSGNAPETGGESLTTASSEEQNAKVESELDKFKEFKSDVLKSLSETKIESASELNKSLKDVTADTQVQAAALNQLSSLPFDKLIGEPLNAAIAAQSEAAKSTLKFIQSVGLKNDKVIMVSFEYIKNGLSKKFQIPLLTLVPIPTFAIKNLDYDFKIKIDASSSASASTSNSLQTTWNAAYNTSLASTNTPAQTEGGSGDEQKPDGNVDGGQGTNNDGQGTNDGGTTDAKGENAAEKAKQQVEADEKKKTEAAAQKKAAEATEKAKLAESAATNNSSQGPSMSVSLSTKKDSVASRESKYSVEATMDIHIIAGQDDLPAGLLTILNVLNNANDTYDPDGELTLSSSEVTIGSNGKASITAKYLNEEGIYAPSSIKCSDGTVTVISKKDAYITFTAAGVYAVTAGSQTASVTVYA